MSRHNLQSGMLLGKVRLVSCIGHIRKVLEEHTVDGELQTAGFVR